MAYIKRTSQETEYSGESFQVSLTKDNGEAWADTETAIYTLYDTSGNVVSTGDVDQSSDSKQLNVIVPYSDTANVTGRHKLLVELLNSGDPRIKDVIAEYEINYLERKA